MVLVDTKHCLTRIKISYYNVYFPIVNIRDMRSLVEFSFSDLNSEENDLVWACKHIAATRAEQIDTYSHIQDM